MVALLVGMAAEEGHKERPERDLGAQRNGGG